MSSGKLVINQIMQPKVFFFSKQFSFVDKKFIILYESVFPSSTFYLHQMSYADEVDSQKTLFSQTEPFQIHI